MHVRFSSCIGMEVREQHSQSVLGNVVGLFIHPDTAAIEGIFVEIPQFLNRQILFASTANILHWGKRITINSAEDLGPIGDIVRYIPLLENYRPIVGQRVRTESGAYIGRCKDVQFSTERMKVTWAFPKRWWRWRLAFPMTEVLEITPEAIIIRDPLKADKQPAEAVIEVPTSYETTEA